MKIRIDDDDENDDKVGDIDNDDNGGHLVVGLLHRCRQPVN